MEKMKLKYLFFVLFVLIIGCKTEYEKERENVAEFCSSLELEDYWLDCTDIHNYDGGISPYKIHCEFESEKILFKILEYEYNTSCSIVWYLDKEGIELDWEVMQCYGYTYQEAFEHCKGRIPAELKDIKIVPDEMCFTVMDEATKDTIIIGNASMCVEKAAKLNITQDKMNLFIQVCWMAQDATWDVWRNHNCHQYFPGVFG